MAWIPAVRGGIVLSSDMNASSIGKQVLTTRSSRRRDHTDLSLREEADRPAITELVDAYAYCADRRDAASQMALFTEDTDFLVYLDTRNPVPTQHLRRRALPPVFDELNTYEANTHFNGQSTTVLDGNNTSGLTDGLAHHAKVDGSVRTLMIASIRYLDTLSNATARGFSASASSWSIGPKPVHW